MCMQDLLQQRTRGTASTELQIWLMSAAHKYICMGRTSEGVECCRTGSDPILCVHPLPPWVMWPAQWAQGGGNTAQLTRSGVLGEITSSWRLQKRDKRQQNTDVHCHSRTTAVLCQLSQSWSTSVRNQLLTSTNYWPVRTQCKRCRLHCTTFDLQIRMR